MRGWEVVPSGERTGNRAIRVGGCEKGNVADLGASVEITQLQREREKRANDQNFQIKKLKIGKGDFKGLIIDQSETQEGLIRKSIFSVGV